MNDFTVVHWHKLRIDFLPPIGKPVLWQYENGDIIHIAITDDMTFEDLRLCFAGDNKTGPIVRWMNTPP